MPSVRSPPVYSTMETKRTSGRKGVGRNIKRGKLRDFLRLPMELILQICAYLLPKDLLHLARVNKDFRTLFMSRSSRLLWESALRNVGGLPSCPKDMSEPAYAELVSFLNCHECGAEHSKKTGVTMYSGGKKSCNMSSAGSLFSAIH